MTKLTNGRLEQVQTTLRLFVGNGQVTELRAFAAGGDTICNVMYRNVEDMVRRVNQLESEGRASGIYFIPNAILPDRVPAGRPLKSGSAKAEDIARRLWLLIDADPVRFGPDGQSLGEGKAQVIPSTDAEKATSWELISNCRALLDGMGFVGAVLGDSGNGYHLCYPVDLPPGLPGDETYNKVDTLLAELEARYGTASCHIDQKPKDAPRIWKLYGTIARKGPESPGRPWRASRLLEYADPTAEARAANNLALDALLAIWASQRSLGEVPRPATGGAGQQGVIERAIAYLERCDPSVSGAGGHDDCYWPARALAWGFDLGSELAFDLLWQHFNSRCSPPWSAAELRHKCHDADTRPFNKPRGWLLEESRDDSWSARQNQGPGDKTSTGVAKSTGKKGTGGVVSVLSCVVQAPASLEEYVPFPVEHLPRPLQMYVLEGSEALNCDPAYLALPVLAVAAGMVGCARSIRLKRTWSEPAVLWTAIISDSGTMKTPAWKAALAPVWKMQKQAMLAHRDEMRDYKARLKEAKENGKEDEFSDRKPVQERVVVSDTTIERLAEILEDNPRGVLVARDEISGWLGSFTKYKAKGAGSDLPNWLELHSAGPITVDRKTGDRRLVFIERAAASVTGGIQGGTLARAMTAEFFESGLTARLLLAWPTRRPKIWTEAEVSVEAEMDYAEILSRLRGLAMDQRDGEMVPRRVELRPETKRRWVSWYNSWAKEQADAEGELASAYSKLEACAPRLALIHHLVLQLDSGRDEGDPVALESMEAGIALVHWFAREARRIYTHLAETTEQRDTRKLLEWLARRGGRCTARELQRSNNRKYPAAERADTVLDGLVNLGLGRWLEEQSGMDGGRPKRTFELCTTHDKTDTTSQPVIGQQEVAGDTTLGDVL